MCFYRKHKEKRYIPYYAQILIVVKLIFVNIICFLVITRNPVEILDHVKTQASYHPPGPPYTLQ